MVYAPPMYAMQSARSSSVAARPVSRPLAPTRLSMGNQAILRRQAAHDHACPSCRDNRGPCTACGASHDRKAGSTAMNLVAEVVGSGRGQPLAPPTQALFTNRFGFDFSRVRVHDDAAASTSARAVNAVAYTVGDSIVFRHGAYNPGSPAGQRLLAHELTHVVQQAGASHASLDRQGLETGATDSPREREAEAMAGAVTGGGSPAGTGLPVYFCSKPIMLASIHGKRHAFFRIGGTGAGNESYGLQHAKSCPCAWQGWPRHNDPSDHDATDASCIPTAIPEARFLAEWNRYNVGQYCAWGPNSNTYARTIAERLGHTTPPPGDLPGYHDTEPSAGSSGPNPYMTALLPLSCFDSMCDGCPTD